ncbi:DUF2897 family protein [Litorilituus sediminis]|uniref:DUF2897 family protein n=1 Tax=Litorilituus sediminis TaxID=718192 RepID=A0A4P6P1D3_9GAMM|nr:DUF2897 family protein [Litorilituus sediminis]QBG35076.1 DUF2897 family protein [Litorilituus sediminis]
MSLSLIFIILIALGIIIGGILLLKQSAKKFNLSPEQLKRIKARNEALDKEAREEEEKKQP